eukprot:302825-Ditylum_brightwellii.AAC.1
MEALGVTPFGQHMRRNAVAILEGEVVGFVANTLDLCVAVCCEACHQYANFGSDGVDMCYRGWLQ